MILFFLWKVTWVGTFFLPQNRLQNNQNWNKQTQAYFMDFPVLFLCNAPINVKPKRQILEQIFHASCLSNAEAHVSGVKFIGLYETVGLIKTWDFSFWGESDLWSDVWSAMDGVVSLLAEVSHDEAKIKLICCSPSGDTQTYRVL